MHQTHGDTNGENKRTPQTAALPAGMRPAVLNEKQAAAYLGISPRTLWALAAGEEVPCVRIGKAKRYRTADLDAYLTNLSR